MQAVPADHMGAIAADYPAWHVWRDLTRAGGENGWNATLRRNRGPVPHEVLQRVSASTPEGLRGLLQQQEILRQAIAA